MKKTFIAFLALAAIAALATTANGAGLNPALVKKGKTIFTTNCETCHGAKADGMGPVGQYMSPHPRNLVKDKFINKHGGDSVAGIYWVVTNGLPGTAMAGFPQLTDAQRHAVATYVKSLRAH